MRCGIQILLLYRCVILDMNLVALSKQNMNIDCHDRYSRKGKCMNMSSGETRPWCYAVIMRVIARLSHFDLTPAELREALGVDRSLRMRRAVDRSARLLHYNIVLFH